MNEIEGYLRLNRTHPGDTLPPLPDLQWHRLEIERKSINGKLKREGTDMNG